MDFDSESAEKARHRALKGVKSKNYEDEAADYLCMDNVSWVGTGCGAPNILPIAMGGFRQVVVGNRGILVVRVLRSHAADETTVAEASVVTGNAAQQTAQ